MKSWALTLLAAAMIACAVGTAEAAVIAPVKQYIKPNEPLDIKFLNENEQGKKALEKIGLAATELDGMFTPATHDDILEAGGAPKFAMHKFDGTKIESQGVKMEWTAGNNKLDLATFFPQVKEPGTYILTWKDAAPLVIETLRDPVQWAGMLATPEAQAAELKRILSDIAVITHVELLQYAVITTDKGAIKAKFAYDVAPHTVDNFISLSQQKFYDGSAFHRIIAGFMIQGGDSLTNVKGRAGTGGAGYSLPAEFNAKTHARGVLSMARGKAEDSAGSQFFIMHAAKDFLDGKYTAFGDVIDGMNAVDDIAKTPVSDNNGTVSGEMPKIESIRILPATTEMYGIKK